MGEREGLVARLGREWLYLSGLVRTLLRVRSIAAHSPNLMTDDLEAAVDRWRNRDFHCNAGSVWPLIQPARRETRGGHHSPVQRIGRLRRGHL